MDTIVLNYTLNNCTFYDGSFAMFLVAKTESTTLQIVSTKKAQEKSRSYFTHGTKLMSIVF